MTATPPDPLATQHDSIPDPDTEAPVDTQTLRLREENRALRELLAAQVQAALPQQQPGLFRRLCWGLISAPGAALVGWRSLIGRDDASTPITRRRVGYATLTVLYTLAIYGALVLLVVSWSSPNATMSGATAAGPVRVPLVPAPPLPPGADPVLEQAVAPAQEPAPPAAEPESSPATQQPEQPAAQPAAAAASSPTAASAPAAAAPASPAESHAESTGPHSTLRITEIAAPDPLAWVGALREELARCAELGFFERPDCAWTARKQFCEPNQGWGAVKECPAQP
ncbi:hypothetical protein ABE485_28995 [Achromobacter spanius]|uniref:hypothetical protein n=1 Tax=Achromobacter spanius TaxID=217203 RepID=UPI0032081F4D